MSKNHNNRNREPQQGAAVEADVVSAIPPELLPGGAAEKEGSVSVAATVEPRVSQEQVATPGPEQPATHAEMSSPTFPPHWTTVTRKAIKVDMPDGRRYGFKTLKQAQRFMARRGGEMKVIDVDENGYSIADEVASPRRHRLV